VRAKQAKQVAASIAVNAIPATANATITAVDIIKLLSSFYLRTCFKRLARNGKETVNYII
jgi:hypothetical protein